MKNYLQKHPLWKISQEAYSLKKNLQKLYIPGWRIRRSFLPVKNYPLKLWAARPWKIIARSFLISRTFFVVNICHQELVREKQSVDLGGFEIWNAELKNPKLNFSFKTQLRTQTQTQIQLELNSRLWLRRKSWSGRVHTRTHVLFRIPWHQWRWQTIRLLHWFGRRSDSLPPRVAFYLEISNTLTWIVFGKTGWRVCWSNDRYVVYGKTRRPYAYYPQILFFRMVCVYCIGVKIKFWSKLITQ